MCLVGDTVQITFIGYICIALTIYSLIKFDKNYLLLYAIFFSGFTGSSVISLSDHSLQPSFYFVILYFLLFSIELIIGRRKIKKGSFFVPFLFFILYCLITIIFPFILSNENIYLSKQNGENYYLRFTLSNLVHIVYLFICFFVFTVLTYNANLKTKNHINLTKNKIINYYRYGFYVVILICLYQIFSFKYNLPFDIFFRQSIHGNVQGNRLYGPCIEASMLCYYLVPTIFLLMIGRKSKLDYIFIFLAIYIGFLTQSSTFLVGILLIFIILIISILSGSFKFKFSNKMILITFSCTVILICVVIKNDFVNLAFEKMIEKFKRGNRSGMERWYGFTNMSLVGLKYPFGVGFGSTRSTDLLSTWLCNIGSFGVLIFVYMIFAYLNNALKNKSFIFGLPFLIVVILMFISVPEPYNIFIWVLMALGYKKKKIEN